MRLLAGLASRVTMMLKATTATASAATARRGAARVATRVAAPQRGALAAPLLPAGPAAAAYGPQFTFAQRSVACSAAYAEEGAAAATEESNQIFVTNLAWATDDGALSRHISDDVGVAGLVRASVFTRDGRSMGRAIVEFESPAQAADAVQALNNTELDGRTLGVRIAEPRPPRGDRPPRERRPREGGFERRERAPREGGYERRPPRDPETLLYVGNLSWSLGWQDVKDAFADAGVPVVRADVKTTPEGRSRGFAIVEMPDAASAARAVEEMDQRELGGRSVNVRRFNVDPPGGRE